MDQNISDGQSDDIDLGQFNGQKRVRFQFQDVKEYVETTSIPKVIDSLEFKMMSSNDIAQLAQFEVTSDRLYEDNFVDPMAYGLLDRRLGVSNKTDLCQTCHKSTVE